MTSDGGLILIRELDERLGLEKLIEEHLSDSRQRLNQQFTLADLVGCAVTRSVRWNRFNLCIIARSLTIALLCRSAPLLNDLDSALELF